LDKREDFYNSYFNGFKTIFPELTREEFLSYYDEDQYLGYPEPEYEGGSMWESEGKSIYVLIRILKPKTILEIGNFKGVSANHILSAVEKNDIGDVTLLDIVEVMEYNRLHNTKFTRILQSSLDFLNNPVDFELIIEDACHEYDFVKFETELIRNNNQNPNYYVWSHDYYSINNWCQVKQVYDENRDKYSLFLPMKDSVSDCGFIITKK